MVDAAGQPWPDGWVKGEGFVRPKGESDPLKAPPRFVDIGEEYVRQIVDVSPGQRKRYLGHLKVLGETRVRGRLAFTKPVTAITEADLKDWLIGNKARKRNAEDDASDTPGWLAKQLKPKHTMRDHHLGSPKTPKSRRTITISSAVAVVLARRVEGKEPDDFVFTSRSGLPLHNGDYTHVWRKLMKALAAEDIASFRFHDLRRTHVAWLVAAWCSPAPFPGPPRPRVDHHDDRHLRPLAPRPRVS